ncbi:MAG: amidohydrolase family protein [Actinomycetes bacterium]
MSTDSADSWGIAIDSSIDEALADLRLVDHHVHGPLRGDVTREELELLITESDRPAPVGTQFDSQVGFAIRAHCAPLIGLPAHASADEYWQERARRSAEELTRTFLGASGTAHWLLETGYKGDQILDPQGLAALGVGRVSEVVRLESVLESVARGSAAGDLADRFTDALAERAASAVGLKSIVAYRYGFDFAPTRPSAAEVANAAGGWLREIDAGADPKVVDPTLLRMLLWAGVDTGLPLQLHTGYGDADVELHRCDPLLLTSWLKAIEGSGTKVLLLHCYPYHRNAGYLAQVYPHVYFDVGLAVNYTGAASPRVIAESLELAPFSKVLYSSDAWGPPELHYLGAALWRRGTARALTAFVRDGQWAAEDAVRVADMIGRTNALRVYGLSDE